MRKWLICVVAVLAVLTMRAQAAQVPQEVAEALPRDSAWLLEDTDLSGAGGLSGGLAAIWDRVAGHVEGAVRQRLRGAVLVVLAALLCGVVDGARQGVGDAGVDLVPMVGALSVTMAATGSLDSLIGLGTETVEQLQVFSKALLPTLAAATASAGALGTATVQQVTTVLFVDVLISLIRELLLPTVYLYIGVLTASACLSDGRLAGLAGALKKVSAWVLSTVLLAFTIYLSVARVISGGADTAAIKLTRAAISGAVPVVGGILSEAAETVLAGAGLLRNTVGVFGMLGVVSICAVPFLHLGLQYLLYKAAAFFSGVVGTPALCKLIDGLAGAFGLVLGMTGACAVLLLVSVLSSVAAVVP